MCRVVRSLESFEDVTELSTVSREVKTSKESNVVLFEGGTDTWNDENINRNGRSTNPRQLRREERFSGGKYGWQAGSKMGGQVTWLARCYFIRGKEDRRISR